MTYKTFISNLTDIIREKRSWPVNASGDKLDQQLRIAYTVAVTIGQGLPMEVLSDLVSSKDLTGSETEGFYESDLPPDMFVVRPDLGIEELEFSTTERYGISEGMDWHAFTCMSADDFQHGNVFFHVDHTQQKLYFHGSDSCTVYYVPMFTKPTSSNYDSTEFPLPEPYVEQAKQMVAQHVQGVLNGNNGLSAVNNMFAQLYGSGKELFAAKEMADVRREMGEEES